MTPMGGDYLIEVVFDGSVTKKLMLRAAAQHMEKKSDLKPMPCANFRMARSIIVT